MPHKQKPCIDNCTLNFMQCSQTALHLFWIFLHEFYQNTTLWDVHLVVSKHIDEDHVDNRINSISDCLQIWSFLE
jgi:hypothetical protein